MSPDDTLMDDTPLDDRRLEAALAAMLERGTWLACLVIGIGLVVQATTAAGHLGLAIVTAGIAVFLALPVVRLLVVLGVLARRRDLAFAGVTALVLAIIAVAFAIGALIPK